MPSAPRRDCVVPDIGCQPGRMRPAARRPARVARPSLPSPFLEDIARAVQVPHVDVGAGQFELGFGLVGALQEGEIRVLGLGRREPAAAQFQLAERQVELGHSPLVA
jgi:hypothetical protein